MTLVQTKEYRVGLRFDRRDARVLRDLADRARIRELGGQVAVFAQAAAAATTGEPLIVICTNPLEAVLMAKGYVRYGVREPTIETVRPGGGPPKRG